MERSRKLPAQVIVALEVMVESGSRFMRRNEFELRMHQRGCDSRAVAGALKALERRGWLEAAGPVIVLAESAFRVPPRPIKPHMLPRQRRIPDLFH